MSAGTPGRGEFLYARRASTSRFTLCGFIMGQQAVDIPDMAALVTGAGQHIHRGISRIIAWLKCSASGQYFSNRQVLLCDLASGHVDPDELSAATNETLARRGSGGAAPRLGPPMLHPAREEHVANVFMVRYLAWLCSG